MTSNTAQLVGDSSAVAISFVPAMFVKTNRTASEINIPLVIPSINTKF